MNTRNLAASPAVRSYRVTPTTRPAEPAGAVATIPAAWPGRGTATSPGRSGGR